MGKVLVCGSIAYDNIMNFPGLFSEQILPDKIHNLNVSFLVKGMKRVRGGTAPNIAYSLALLGEKPMILGTAGKDFFEYRDWLNKNGVDTSYIKIVEDDYTATCYITTDVKNNQITGFYPGAMAQDPKLSLKDLDLTGVSLVLIAPTEPEAMIKWVEECQKLGVSYIYDPGMQIPRLTSEELTRGIMGAKIAIFNEYEYELMKEKTGLSKDEILNSVDLLIVTLGDKGALICGRNQAVQVGVAKTVKVVDPTGAGDAFRAGLIKGYLEGASLEKMGRYASISAVYAVEHKGATEHFYTIDEYKARYRENYGEI
ncbi:MAG TPA: carbohydrate kinase family protein [Pseudobacteroides sp.]|nr:carbohydrate kinase family protein [Pseudobacteroides sp.]